MAIFIEKIPEIKRSARDHYKKILYFSLVHSHITYGILIWGCTHSSIFNSLVLIQKKFIRILAGAKLLDHTRQLFKNLLLLKLQEF